MKTSQQLHLLSKKEFWVLLLLPSVCQFFLRNCWIDFFLLALFYISFRSNTFPFFFMVVLWSIIYGAITLDNSGKEMMALGLVWYFLSSFKIDTDLKKLISATIGCCLYIIMKFCVGSMGCVWSLPMTLMFATYFILLHVSICFLLLILRYQFVKGKLIPW
jgi:hypothetical protein